MATNAQGKSGSARGIYFLVTREIIYLIMAYQKNVKYNLTDAEKAQLRKLTKFLKGER